jgi:hypothetical protein
VHLVPCIRPEGPLEPAPATSLGKAVAGEQWEGFWSLSDERFYTRRTTSTGAEAWFRIGDLGAPAQLRQRDVRVLPFPARFDRGPRMIVGRYRGNAMLVGTQRRRAADKVER